MTVRIPQFHCKDDKGSLIFVIPFDFTSKRGETSSLCEKIFKEIKSKEKKLLFKGRTNGISSLYQEYKGKLCERLHESKSGLFKDAKPTLVSENVCTYCYASKHDLYTGRNLCHCLSICRSFYDERSLFTPRLEMMLGSYNVCYNHYDNENQRKHFAFRLIVSLLLCGEEGGECGYLMYSIPLAFLDEYGFGSHTGNDLDNIIFLKHLFYKRNLHCSINGSEPISLQAWTEKYISELMPLLGISDYPKAFDYSINFRYSMIELNNIVNEEGNMISMHDVKAMMQTYCLQLYGLLTSDEGWQFTAAKEVAPMFQDNYWTSRNYNCSIFSGHNAIIINQYKSDACKYNREYATEWMSNYGDHGNNLTFYKQYIPLEPCIPGVSSFAFDCFLRTIEKDLHVQIATNLTYGKRRNLASRLNFLSNIIQRCTIGNHASMERIIFNQFELPESLKNLRERYQIAANDMQNKKVKILTVVTAFISLCSFTISVLALHVPSISEDIFTGYQSATYYVFYAALITAVLILAIMIVQLIKLFFDR